MPDTVTLYTAGVWVVVGFCTGAGWTLAGVLIGRLLR